MAQTDFTISDVLAWARTKPAGETYDYSSASNCALCQFLRETGRAAKPGVDPDSYRDWGDPHWSRNDRPLPAGADKAASGHGTDEPRETRNTFGAMVARLEKLCPEAPVAPAKWSRLDAYMADIELALS